MIKYLNLYWSFFKNNITRDMYFQANFWMTAGEGVSLLLINLTLYTAIFANVQEIGGWSQMQVMVLISTFQIFTGLIYGLFSDNLPGFQYYINRGDLDYILVKPVSTQFYISTRYVNIGHIFSCLASIPLLIFSLRNLQISPSIGEVIVYVLLVINGLMIGYSLLLAFMSVAVWAIKIGGAYALMMEVISYGKYPGTIFEGILRVIFNFIVPIAFIAHYPSEILFNGVQWSTVISSYLLTAIVLVASHWFFNLSLKYYSSASS